MTYNAIREQYRPAHIEYLLIAESPPPASSRQGSRHFYRTDMLRPDDRLFINTIRAIYPEAMDIAQDELEEHKAEWLQRFAHDGWYMIEALEDSLAHEVSKQQRQTLIRQHLPELLRRVQGLAEPKTKIILIKSNVFDVAAEPLKSAGFNVLNRDIVDYPGRYNQRAFRDKLRALI